MSRFRFFGVRFRLLLLVLLAVLPALGLTLYTHLEQRVLAAADAQEAALRLVRLAAGSQNDTINGTRQLLFALAQLPEMQGTDPDACAAFLAKLLDQYPQYVLLGVIGVDGELLCSAPPAQGQVNLGDRTHFQRARQTRAFAVGDYQIDRVTGKSTISFGQPVLTGQGEIGAIVFASLDLAWLNDLAADAGLPAGSTLTIFDRNGTILARYPDPAQWVGQSAPEAAIVETTLAHQVEGTAETYGVDGVLRLFAFVPLSGASTEEDVYITVGIPTSVAFQKPDRVLFRNLVGLGVVAALVFAAAWFGGDVFIVRRLRQLVSVAQRLSAGDLSARAGPPPNAAHPEAKDELVQLAYAFDNMAESLEKSMTERKLSEQALQAAYQTLEQMVAERTRELSALHDVMAAASASLDLETVMAHSLQHVLTVMNCEIGAIHLRDQSGKLLQLAASQGIPPETMDIAASVSIERGLAGWAVERGEPLVVPDVTKAQRPICVLPAVGNQAYVGVPMRARGRVMGVLSIVGAAGRHFSEREVALLSSIADQVGVAVENAQLYKQAEQLAVMRERQRLARELHDAVTQSLYSLVLVAEASKRLVSAGELDRLGEALTRLGEIGQQTLKEMRLLVYELRPLSLQGEGLIRVLQQRLEAVEKRAGIEATLTVEGVLALPAAVKESLFRVVQEALNNALKHAAARSVAVHIRADDQHVAIEVVDDGRGFDVEAVRDQGGIGLASIRERIDILGGELVILSTPGAGTCVRVTLNVHASWRQENRREMAEAAQEVSQ